MNRVRVSMVGILLAATVIVGCSVELQTPTPESARDTTSRSTPTVVDPIARGRFGDRLEIGDLNLSVEQPETHVVDGQLFVTFQVYAYNARGDDYRIAPRYFGLVDSRGVIHDPVVFDSRIPEDLLLPESRLAREGHVSGLVVFAVADGTTPREVRYEPTYSFNRGVFSAR